LRDIVSTEGQPVFGRLFLLFTLIPIIELAILLQVGQWIGVMPTVAGIVLTALIGAWLARREGTRAWKSVQGSLASGRVPGEALLGALAVFVGGAMLLTPGILTDLAGLALLAPPTRSALLRGIRRRLERRVMRQTGEIQARFWTHDPARSEDDPR
jgi:UPF0716 protein FxsA